MKLKVLTSVKTVVDATVESVSAPGLKGEFQILPRHASYLTLLGEGRGDYVENGRSYPLQISGGIAWIADDQVTLLVDKAETV